MSKIESGKMILNIEQIAGGIQSTELLFRQPEIAQEYQKQRAQNKQAAA